MDIHTVVDTGAVLEVTLTGGTVLWVPRDPANVDYVRVQSWVSAGGVITNAA